MRRSGDLGYDGLAAISVVASRIRPRKTPSVTLSTPYVLVNGEPSLCVQHRHARAGSRASGRSVELPATEDVHVAIRSPSILGRRHRRRDVDAVYDVARHFLEKAPRS